MKYRFLTGETISLFLRASLEERTGVTSIIAAIKATGPNNTIPGPSSPVVETFLIQSRPDGWMLAANPLPVGSYVTNASISLGGTIIKTDPVFFDVLQSVT